MDKKVLVKRLIEKFEPGDYVCKEGDKGFDMYIIKTGAVEVLKKMGGDEMKLATLGPKDFFGEMALFGDDVRTATVKAVKPTEIIVVTKKMLETQYRRVPEWLVTMIKTIANRIITTSRGAKSQFKAGIDYTLLASLLLTLELHGTPTAKGFVIPIDIARDELMYTTGISYDEVDRWLQRFNLVNFIGLKGGAGMLEITDVARVKSYADYLFSLSSEGRNAQIELDSDTRKSFERIHKLMQM